VDGQENPYTVIDANRFAEVQRHLSNSSHFFDFIVVVASKRVFDKMSPANQTAVRQAMAKTVAYQRSLAAEDEQKALANLKTKMTYTEIPPETFAKMRELTAPVVESVKKRAGADLVNQVLSETSK
jgi:TRAP-type C4-dicarboxylate transport system substrate-binding protein